MKTTNCILAEQGLHLHNSGKCNSCSDSLEYWKDQDNNFMDLTTHSIDDIWNSQARIDFLDDLRNGIQNPSCEKCWQKERVGITSKRQISNEQFKYNNKTTPQFIDLKWGNVCNLKCRHCNPWTSSKWLKEWHAVDSKQEYTDYLQDFKSTQQSYHKNNKQNFHDIFFEWFSNSQHLMLYGGEGMYVKDIQEMFSHAIDSGNAKNIDIYINTNGTIYSEKWIEIFKQFRSVRMAFSIDGVKDNFEYIRSGAQWSQVIENYKKYSAISNIQTQIVTTVFTLNVHDIVDIIHTLYNELHTMPAVNFVYGPEWWDIRILPNDVKQHILQRNINRLNHLKEKVTPDVYLSLSEQIDQVQKFLIDTVDNSTDKYQRMKHWICSIDRIRNETFRDIFPEYNQLIKVYI